MPDRLIAQVRHSALWSTATAVFNTGVTFVFSIVLARLLTPEDFGRAAMATFFLGIANALAGTSFGAALVYHRDTDARDLDAVFWTTLGMGGALALALCVAAPWIAEFYAEPVLEPLVRVWSVVLVLSNLNIVPDALLQRDMRISALSRTAAVTGVLHGLVASTCAYLGAQVWALAYAQIAQLCVTLLIKAWLVRWRPGLAAGGGVRFRETCRFAGLYMGGDLLGTLGSSWDNMLVGRLVGSAPLGLYRRARTLPDQVLGVLMQVSRELLVPTFAYAQADVQRVRHLALRAVSLSAGLVMPLLVGLGAIAHEVILVLYGRTWAATAGLMQITVIGLLLSSVSHPIGTLCESRGRPDLRLKLQGAVALAGGVLYSLAVPFGGAAWAAWAYVVLMAVQFVLRCLVGGSLVAIRMRDVLPLLVRPLACALAMLAAVVAVRVALAGAAPALVLAATVPVGAAVYVGLAVALRVEALRLLLALLHPSRDGA